MYGSISRYKHINIYFSSGIPKIAANVSVIHSIYWHINLDLDIL